MLRYTVERNNIDINHKYSWNKNKIEIKSISVNTMLNDLIRKPSKIDNLYFAMYYWLHQKPIIKISKRPISNFKLRPNTIIGTKTTFRYKKYNKRSIINTFYVKLIYSIIPLVKNVNKTINKKYNHTISYGVEDINLMYEPFPDYIGGGNIQILIKSPVKSIGMLYLK